MRASGVQSRVLRGVPHIESIRHILDHCGGLQAGEEALILCDPTTRDLAEAFLVEAAVTTKGAELREFPAATQHGGEPPADIAVRMRSADLIVSLCSFSLAHSRARTAAAGEGARFLSLPQYSWELLESPAITTDYVAREPITRRLGQVLTAGESLRVRSRGGTDMVLDGRGRTANCCPGFVRRPGDLGSPPDIEVNVSPLETKSEGVAVIDGSITCPEIGLLRDPVAVFVRGGRIERFECEDSKLVTLLERMFEGPDSKRRVLAECGVGLNPHAELTGTMLTDEGALGCMHFGFGANHTVGGQNEVDFHLDFVFPHASLDVDGVAVLADGELVE